MEKIELLCNEMINERLCQVIVSNPRIKDKIVKIKIRPVLIKNEILFQIESFTKKQVFHSNMDKKEVIEYILTEVITNFMQMEIKHQDFNANVLISKKGTITVKKKAIQEKEKREHVTLEHNKSKRYIIEEGTVVPFLLDLNVQGKDGKILKQKYDKFRQINRYLEFVQDILYKLPSDRMIKIIDFGCGKSYLTFALYYFLKIMNHREVSIIGLDLKEDVIAKCNALSKQYGYDDLSFQVGDISNYEELESVDMVVTLHACDTATDYALYKAIRWNAKVIFAVPCCQHEINGQIKSKEFDTILKYGLIKERMSSLFTDAIRANLLENEGYDVSVMEFIDMEHTPKNILIRAVKESDDKSNYEKLESFCEKFNIETTLQKLLKQEE
ncbi:MAG: class I SAM-dependent methyltransferase [Lachnospiraceae bacterium]